MLPIAIIILVLGTIYAVSIAPADQRVKVGGVLIVLTAIGYAVGFAITKEGSDQRTFYPIAAAIGGTMIAFAWISKQQKSWPKKDGKA